MTIVDWAVEDRRKEQQVGWDSYMSNTYRYQAGYKVCRCQGENTFLPKNLVSKEFDHQT